MSTTSSRKLVMTFGGGEDASNVNVTVYDHKENLDSETVANTMNEVVALEVLQDADGHLMTDAVSAKEVLTTENILF